VTSPTRWGTALAAAVLAVGQIILIVASWGNAAANAYEQRGSALTMVVVGALFVVTGLLVVRHRPGSAIGWLTAMIGVGWLLYQGAVQYAVYGLLVAPLPAVGAVGVLTQTLWIVPFGLVPVLLLVYPTDRLVGPGWRWAVGAAVAAMAALLGAGTPLLWPLRDQAHGLVFDAEFQAIPAPVEALLGLVTLGVLGVSLAAVVSLVLRWRRSAGIERFQLKWLLLSGLVLLLAATVSSAQIVTAAVPQVVADALLAIGLGSLPVAVAVAITRHRLYEIDRLLSRTVTYATLTAVLVGIYAAGVLAVGAVTGAATGGAGGDLAVAVATLAVAAAFLPARRTIQRLVDRRFNRARYDAERTVAEFGARLRDEVDLDTLAADLRQVVGATVAPASTGLWFRTPDA
jgi:hypothetical protein